MNWLKRGRRTVTLVALFVSVGLGAIWYLPPATGKDEVDGADAKEAAAIKEVVEIALAEMRKNYSGNSGIVRRDAHAKAHGCVKATFKVDTQIPSEFAVGSFAKSGHTFKAWVRYSNGAFRPRSDDQYDGRGMAVKLLYSEPDKPSGETAVALTHDILMIGHPIFFSSDPADYLEFARAGGMTGDGIGEFFFPGYNPFNWRIRQAWIGYQLSSKEIESPLRMTYFSIVPFTFGDSLHIKYSSRRRQCPGASASKDINIDKSDPDYLRKAMESELKDRSVCFDLLAQKRTGSLPINDATVEWPEADAPFQLLGLIKIPSQDFSKPARTNFCENTSFNPFNTPAGITPAGGINRMRQAVYKAISKHRRERNSVDAPDAHAMWDSGE